MTSGRIVGTYRFAGVAVRVESLHPDVHGLCQAYRCDGASDLVVRISQDDIDFERERTNGAQGQSLRAASDGANGVERDRQCVRSDGAAEREVCMPSDDGIEGRRSCDHSDSAAGRRTYFSSDEYLETLAVYRKIAEALPSCETVLMHGSCVAVDGAAYLFCAPSGTGKSTHVRLWRELLQDRAVMVNDDKPLVRVSDGGAIAHGTPWDGKHRLSSDVAVPLRAICLLERAKINHIERLTAAEAYPALLQHVYRPLDPAALALTLGLVDRLVACAELWRLRCNTDIEAARISFSAMSEGELL